MEAMYKTLLGPINPKDPSESFRLQLWLLKRLGLWAPETDNKFIQALYTLWSYFYRWFFLYTYTATQILFFLNVEDLADVAEGFFLLLTQIALIYKVEKFYSNRHRIRACEKLLKSSLFRPKDVDADIVISEAMVQTLAFSMAFLVLAQLTIASWAVLPFLEDKLRLPIAAWYPFSVDNPWVFTLIYVYQIFGISMSACFNVATDTFASAMVSHANGQVKSLGVQISKIGYENDIDMNLFQNGKREISVAEHDKAFVVDEQMVAIKSEVAQLQAQHSKSKHYGDVSYCIIYHEHILRFTEEIQDIFKGPIFAQLIASCVIICMTCLLMVNQLNNPAALSSTVSYLLTMVMQVFLFCYTGNELIYGSHSLTTQAFFANFQDFDRPTAKAMLLFMQRTLKDITVKAGGLFEVTLSLETFMGIMKSSYSYFALLQSMQNK